MLLCAGLLVLPVNVAAVPPPELKATLALYESKQMEFTPDTSMFGRRLYVGEMVLGQLLPAQRPNDHRLNLYIVMPGSQYDSADGAKKFNLVLSAMPRTQAPIDWDVYWALVLDPTLKTDLTSERALILATQAGFHLPDFAAFEDLPAAMALRDYLHLKSLDDLGKLRRPDGTLPRIIIVPAGFGVRAGAVDPDSPSPCGGEGTLARAVSRLSRRCLQPGSKPADGGQARPTAPASPK